MTTITLLIMKQISSSYIFGFITQPYKDYQKLLDEFQLKFPPSHKSGKTKVIRGLGFIVLDGSSYAPKINDDECDLLQKKLECFPFHKMLLRKDIFIKYNNNLIRLLKTNNRTLKLHNIQSILENKELKKIRPYLLGSRFRLF